MLFLSICDAVTFTYGHFLISLQSKMASTAGSTAVDTAISGPQTPTVRQRFSDFAHFVVNTDEEQVKVLGRTKESWGKYSFSAILVHEYFNLFSRSKFSTNASKFTFANYYVFSQTSDDEDEPICCAAEEMPWKLIVVSSGFMCAP